MNLVNMLAEMIYTFVGGFLAVPPTKAEFFLQWPRFDSSLSLLLHFNSLIKKNTENYFKKVNHSGIWKCMHSVIKQAY